MIFGHFLSFLLWISKSVVLLFIYFILLQNLNDFQDKFEPPTTTFQVQGRVAAIVVVLSVILVCAIISTILCWKMRYPATASYLNAVLFFFIFLVFLIGTSVIRAMVTLANNGCLYAETFVTTTLLNTINNPAEQIWLKRALDFYLNPTAPTGNLGESALSEVAGVNIVPILDAIQSPVVETLLGVLDSRVVQTALNFALEDATVKAINDLADIIQPLSTTSKWQITNRIGYFLYWIALATTIAPDCTK